MKNSILAGVEATLGKDLTQKIQNSKILVVGAGGIGCELLKNLALTGFADLKVVDLDTIDVSNLNRQLLFRSQHVGMPKCTVACEVATEMAAACGFEVKYEAIHGNICDNAQFHVNFVSQFDLVLSALDNVQARQRVNRLALAANVPLVEAGTTGYLGQVNVIHRPSQTACYECKPAVTQKVYPICTIRSTPSMPVHTIVWAKEFYKLLYADKMEESMLFEDTSATGDASTYMDVAERVRTALRTEEGLQEVTLELLKAMYVDEIQKQLDMDRYKTVPKTPEPLEASLLENLTTAPTKRSNYVATQIWSPTDCVAELVACICDSHNGTPLLAFDKDDALSMRFVTAASNLRSYVFGIEPLQSYYSAKGIAGNIIPAIATTNAIAAGLQILQCFHLLRAMIEKKETLVEDCRYVSICRQKMRNGLILTAGAIDASNPDCYVCRSATLPLSLDTTRWTLQELVERVLKRGLGFQEPTILFQDDFIYEEGEGADDSLVVNLPKTLDKLPGGGVLSGSVLEVSDNALDLEVQMVVTHQAVEDDHLAEESLTYALGGKKPVPVASAAASKRESNSSTTVNDNDDVVEVVETDAGSSRDKKRPASNGNGEAAKRAKTNRDDEAILLH